MVRAACAAAILAGLAGAAAPSPGAAPWRALLLPALRRTAAALGVPPELADAVAAVESGYTIAATGRAGEVGLMQILPATAALMGFRGPPADLFDPGTNIRFATAYLARAWMASGGNPCRALMKYRAGVAEEGYSPLSITYCRRARDFLAQIGAPLAAALAASIPAAPTIADPPGAAAPPPVDFTALAALAGTPVRAAPPPHAGAAAAEAAIAAALAE